MQLMKEKLLNLLEISVFIAVYILFFVIWHEIRWLGVILLFFIAPFSLYATYEFLKDQLPDVKYKVFDHCGHSILPEALSLGLDFIQTNINK